MINKLKVIYEYTTIGIISFFSNFILQIITQESSGNNFFTPLNNVVNVAYLRIICLYEYIIYI